MTTSAEIPDGVVRRYIELGLALGRHVDGFVDAYYGPPAPASRAALGDAAPAPTLVAAARTLLAALDAGEPLDEASADAADSDIVTASRRRWLRAQVFGLLTSARKIAGEPVGYVEEVESCYGVRPTPVDVDEFAAAHERLADALPGSGPVGDRLIAWRESHVVAPDRLPVAIASLAEELRDKTGQLFGLPDDEHVDFELVRDKPWSGFNTYLGNLRSSVAVNTDLPVLSMSLPHLVAHEAYPGHHTEHCRKEVGLVRRRHWLEESIFLVGTPQCLIAEGLADLGLETILGRRPEAAVTPHMQALGIRYDAEVIAAVADAGEVLGSVRGNAAWRLHVDGADPDTVIDEVARWALLPRARAAKSVEFLLHPTWGSYISCYVEGLPLCRRFVGGDPARFGRLLTEQLVPADLVAA